MADKFDAVVASMAITPERREKVDFTRKYYISPAKFVARKDAGIEISPEGLAGKTACVQGATIHENYLRDSFPKLTIQTYETQQDATFDLVAGRCDVLLGEATVLSTGFLKQPEGAEFEYVGPAVADPRWYGEGAGIAVRKGNTELVELLNRAIDEIRANGTYARINAKYFDFDLYGE
jgi:ABC-type amino acid transport substrate-binding protein